MYMLGVVVLFIDISLAMPGNNLGAMLEPRDAVQFWGGYTLAHSGTTCPASTFQCVGSDVNGRDNSYACCPTGSYCFNSGYTYCCPDNNDCGTKLGTEPVCADTDWTLWSDPNVHGPFCCQQGEIPIADPDAPFGECWAAGSPVVSSEIASSMTQIPVTFLPFSATGSGVVVPTASGKITNPGSPGSTSSAIAAATSDVSKVVLSRDAIIGIAVGGFVFLVLVLLGVGCCCWKCCCKNRRNRRAAGVNAYEPYRGMGPEDNFQKMEMRVAENMIGELDGRRY